MNRNKRSGEPSWREALAKFDPQAARRPASLYAARALVIHGARMPAQAAYREFLERAPNHPGALRGLAALLAFDGRFEEAAECRQRAHEVDLAQMGIAQENREEAARFRLAAEGGAPQPVKAPGAYVATFFDEFAETFEVRLVQDLRYRAPQLLYERVEGLLGEKRGRLRILDAGCGTGLAGELFRPLATQLDGVDLSPRMVEHAERKKIYDHLEVGELVEILKSRREAYDLIVAADVFCYFGDLQPVFDASRMALAGDGLLAFTVEKGLEPGYRLGSTRRYLHERTYIEASTRDAELMMIHMDAVVLRNEKDCPVAGYACILGRPGRDR